MADLFDTAKPVTNQQRVAAALTDGMSRDLRFVAEVSGLDAKQAHTALHGLHANNRVMRMADGYWAITPRGTRWPEEVSRG